MMQFFERVTICGISCEFVEIQASLPHCKSYDFIPEFAAHRQAEFAAGRFVARRALNTHGFPNVEQLRRYESGNVAWPSGAIGSITHSPTHACAVVANSKDFRSIGVDIEPQESCKALYPLRQYFLRPEERSVSECESLIVYSAKESLFKALFPMTNVFFGFKSAIVESIGDKELKVFLKDSVGDFCRGTGFDIKFDYVHGHVMTLCTVN